MKMRLTKYMCLSLIAFSNAYCLDNVSGLPEQDPSQKAIKQAESLKKRLAAIKYLNNNIITEITTLNLVQKKLQENNDPENLKIEQDLIKDLKLAEKKRDADLKALEEEISRLEIRDFMWYLVGK